MNVKSIVRTIAFITMALFAMGCAQHRMALPKPPPPPPAPPAPELDYRDVREQSYRTRTKVPVSQNRYEGSLWEDESSWGNLLRDHRARFSRDVLTITDLPDIITVPKPEKKVVANPVAPDPGEAVAGQINQLLDVANKVTEQDRVEEEQAEVLGSLKSISARVSRVLPNGNMMITGEKVEYRRQNTVRYVTKVTGIIRPEDVTDKNEVTAVKLARSEVHVKRQVMASKYNLNALAPVIGGQKAGLLDRLSHIATPTGNNTNTPVGTR